MSKYCRGIRGAITAKENSKQEILNVSKTLLKEMLAINHVHSEDIVSILFSVTKDLSRAFPAAAARELGFTYTPLLCLNEIDVEGSLQKCVRILMHVNSTLSQKEIKHCYMGDAKILRPEL